MIVAAIVAVIVVPPLFVAWSLCRAAALGDRILFDDPDVCCPNCDGSDLLDWGEDDWYACNNCRILFQHEGRPW